MFIKSTKLHTVLAGLAAMAALSPAAVTAEDTSGAVAVVELFTSQGCSSCPPAERVLGGIAQQAAQAHRRVFTLAFHVDYWNHLGWADPFSSADFSARQQWYGRAFALDQVYTPQMVVNGRTQFVGSDGAAAKRAVAEALAMPATVPISLQAEPASGGVNVTCSTHGSPFQGTANVAVVEQGLATEVKRGENAGRLLDQPSVVRWFQSQPANGDFSVTIPPLPAVRAGKGTIVVFVQRSVHDSAVLGAASVLFP